MFIPLTTGKTITPIYVPSVTPTVSSNRVGNLEQMPSSNGNTLPDDFTMPLAIGFVLLVAIMFVGAMHILAKIMKNIEGEK